MRTNNEKFIEIQNILTISDVHPVDCNKILDLILEFYKDLSEQLKQENKRLNGAIQTYDILLKSNVEANKQLKLINQEHQQINGQLRQANKILNEQYIRLYKDYIQLKDNWNMLKEYIRKNIIYDDVGMKILDPSPLEDYMQELEQGSDNKC